MVEQVAKQVLKQVLKHLLKHLLKQKLKQNPSPIPTRPGCYNLHGTSPELREPSPET